MSITGVKTIAFVCPADFVIEIGEMPCQQSLAEITKNIQEIIKAGAAMYTLQMVRNLTPAFSGDPTRRKRLFIIGWRVEMRGATVTQPLLSLIGKPMPAKQTCLVLHTGGEQSIGLVLGNALCRRTC